MYWMLLGDGLQACALTVSAWCAALRGIKEKNKKQISKPNREMITLLFAACDISRS